MSFTINCNSNNVFEGANPSQLTYAFDFSVVEDCPYKVHVKIITQQTTIVDDTLYLVSIPDLGVNLNSYTAGSKTSATSSSVVCMASPYYILDTTAVPANFSYLKGSSFFYINNRPRSSTFTVFIKDKAGVALPVPTDYCLTLTFEKLK